METYKDVIPTGRYKATIIDIECNSNVRFGNHISDVFKTVYSIDDDKCLSLKSDQDKDNGICVYKKMAGNKVEPNRNRRNAKDLNIYK